MRSSSASTPVVPPSNRMRRTLVLVGTLVAVSALGAGALVSCKDDPHLRSDGGSAISGGECVAKPGELPEPTCDNSSKECTPQPGCTVDETACGSASTCLPLADQKGKKQKDLRMRRLNIAAPDALAAEFIQRTVVTQNIDLDKKACGEVGKGLFTWILRVDRETNELVTGGAPPPKDPFGQGFCFANFSAGGIPIEPARFPIAFEGDTFHTTEKKKLNVPVFLSEDLSSSIVLPLSDVTISGVTLTDDGNCIGSFRKEGLLGSECVEDTSSCPKWLTSGALGGYMTLEEADAVTIQELARSLCVVLSKGVPGPNGKCARDAEGKIVFKGDYCSTSKKAGDCGDSMWLAATFAASGATIFDGQGVPGCSGFGRDGGTDASQPDAQAPDAAADASRDATPE